MDIFGIIVASVIIPLLALIAYAVVKADREWDKDTAEAWDASERPDSYSSWAEALDKKLQGVITAEEMHALQLPYVNAQRANLGLPPIERTSSGGKG